MKLLKIINRPYIYGGIEEKYCSCIERFGIYKNIPKCVSCKEKMSPDEIPYVAEFVDIAEDKIVRRLVHRKCAYGYKRGVIERNGEIKYEYSGT